MTTPTKKELIITDDELGLFPSFKLYAQCDRCSARSKALVMVSSGRFLAFCNHHFNEHSDKLAQIDALIHFKKEDKTV